MHAYEMPVFATGSTDWDRALYATSADEPECESASMHSLVYLILQTPRRPILLKAALAVMSTSVSQIDCFLLFGVCVWSCLTALFPDSDLPAAKKHQPDYDDVLVQSAGDEAKPSAASPYAEVLVVAPAVSSSRPPEDGDYIDVSQSAKAPQSDYSTFKPLPVDSNPSAHEYEGKCDRLASAQFS